MSSPIEPQFDWDNLTYTALDESLAENQRWSTWPSVEHLHHGPRPYPDWLVTSSAAIDTDLGVLKTGKEADVVLVERAVPGDPQQSCLLAPSATAPSTTGSSGATRAIRRGGRSATPAPWHASPATGVRSKPACGLKPNGRA